nr:MAG TPA: hypothetical protein [Caudoviricetes sp.]
MLVERLTCLLRLSFLLTIVIIRGSAPVVNSPFRLRLLSKLLHIQIKFQRLLLHLLVVGYIKIFF